MKIPSKTIAFKQLDEGYGDLYAKVPRTVKEKWIRRFQEASSDSENPDVQRSANIWLLELVQEWNLTDDSDKILPLVSSVSCKCKEGNHVKECPKQEVVGEVLVEFLPLLAKTISGQPDETVPEPVQDF